MSSKKIPKREKYCPFGLRLLEAFGTDQYAIIARKAETAVSAVGNYMKGNRVPDADFLKRVSSQTGYSIHWLLMGEGPKKVVELKREAGELVEEIDIEQIKREARREARREIAHELMRDLILGKELRQVKRKAS